MVVLTHKLPNARESSAGAHSYNHVGHLSAGLLPNFRPGGESVALGIGRVVILVR